MRVSSTERKEQLIQATVDLMRRHGVQQVTLRDVAKEAGAPLAAVHYCFDDKTELLRAAAEHWLRAMVDDFAPGDGGCTGLRETLHRIGAHFFDALDENPPDVLAQLELVMWATRNDSLDGLAKSIYARYEADLAEAIATVLEQSGESTRMPPEELARAFLVLIDGCSLQSLADPDRRLRRDLFETLLSGLLDRTLIVPPSG